MKLITLQPDNSFHLEGKDISMQEIFDYKFRIHKANGDIEIYEKREDIPEPVASFDLYSYKQQVNDAHNALFRSLYQARNYLSIGEIPIWITDDEFGQEAIALKDWWIETCKIVSTYLDRVTEETAIPVDEFIQTLPTL